MILSLYFSIDMSTLQKKIFIQRKMMNRTLPDLQSTKKLMRYRYKISFESASMGYGGDDHGDDVILDRCQK